MFANLVQAPSKLMAQNALALKQVFKEITTESCPRDYNFHMHTVYSDGQLQPEALVEQAIAIGLKGFAITDHHTIEGYQVAQQYLSDRRRSSDRADSIPHLWTGFEVTANLLGTEVHILGFAFDPEHSVLRPYLTCQAPTGDTARAGEVIAAIHHAGGLAVLAHPARYKRSHSELVPEAARLGIDGVEAYYAYNNPSPWKPSPLQTQEVQELSVTHGLLNSCGTDTHGLSLLQRL